MKKWYLLYCKRQQLLRAMQHLTQQNVRCLAPHYEVEKCYRGRRNIVIEPLFPNYLFVEFDYEHIAMSTVQATRGVSHFIRFGPWPVIVPEEVINSLHARENESPPSSSLPQPGDSVIIREGIYAGISAIYGQPDGMTRAILLLNLLNTTVPKSFDNREFD